MFHIVTAHVWRKSVAGVERYYFARQLYFYKTISRNHLALVKSGIAPLLWFQLAVDGCKAVEVLNGKNDM